MSELGAMNLGFQQSIKATRKNLSIQGFVCSSPANEVKARFNQTHPQTPKITQTCQLDT